jgi:hypothetical protein
LAGSYRLPAGRFLLLDLNLLTALNKKWTVAQNDFHSCGADGPADLAQANIVLPLVIFPGTVIEDTCCVSFTDTTEWSDWLICQERSEHLCGTRMGT